MHHVTYKWVRSRMHDSGHTCMTSVTHQRGMSCMHESCHISLSHVPYVWVVSRMHESCRIWMSPVTYPWVMKTWPSIGNISHNTYEWVLSHMHEACHVWMSHVSFFSVLSNEDLAQYRRHASWPLVVQEWIIRLSLILRAHHLYLSTPPLPATPLVLLLHGPIHLRYMTHSCVTLLVSVRDALLLALRADMTLLYLHIYIYKYKCIYINIYRYISIDMYTYRCISFIHVWPFLCRCGGACFVWRFAKIWRYFVCMYMQINTYIYAYINICIHIYIYTYIYIYRYIYIYICL